MKKSTAFSRAVGGIRLTLVLGFALVLLIFVGYGDARLSLPGFAVEKLAAQGELVQGAMKSFLLADLPLQQYPGFGTITQPILDSDPDIYAIYVTNLPGDMVFANSRAEGLTSAEEFGEFSTSALQADGDLFAVGENDSYYQVSFPLSNRFTEVGTLNVVLQKTVVSDTLNETFLAVIGVALIAISAFMLFIFVTSRWWVATETEGGWKQSGMRLLNTSYSITFLLVSLLVISALMFLYINGTRGKIRAMANTLEYRLNSAFELGLTIDDFTGIETVFAEYEEINPDLSYVVLTVDDNIAIHSDPDQVGTTWTAKGDHFEEALAIGEDSGSSLRLGIPKSVVYSTLWKSARNFLALFIATIFLSRLFFSLIQSLSTRPSLEPGTLHTKRGFLLSLIGPFYFVSIFIIHGLTTAFLPRYFLELGAAEGITNISSLFSTYYLTYTLALFLTAKPADKRGPKPFLVTGAFMIVAAMVGLSFVEDFYAMYAIQAIIGFGEGMLFNAVFTFVIRVASAEHRNVGAGIIVTSLYSGWLSGTAIGALLAADPAVGLRGVFILGAGLAALNALYVSFIIPRIRGEDFDAKIASEFEPETMRRQTVILPRKEAMQRVAEAAGKKPAKQRGGIFRSFGDLDFLKTAIFIGVPVKIIVAGLLKASLPLVLNNQNFLTEDIGQIMMLYFGGVLLSSSIATRLADKLGNTRVILVLGGVGSGVGLILMGAMGLKLDIFTEQPFLTTLLLLLGMLILGFAHGFIQAPIITHISNTRTANTQGQATANSIYRFYERIGNIGGPLLIGVWMTQTSYDAMTITYIGAVILVFGLLFFLLPGRRKKAAVS